jgi:hypothetical protein
MFSISAAVVGSLLAVGTASAEFQGISIETVDNGMGLGTTYRVYVDVEAGDQVNAIFGDNVDLLTVNGVDGASIYQNEFGGATSISINSNFFAFFPSLEWDSYVTIGALHSDGTPFGNNALLDIGIDFAAFEAGGTLSTDNGSWFATPADDQVFELDGRVLIGQFTVDGDIEGIINIQGKNADLTNWQQRGIAFSSAVIPAPGAIALLGLAGLASRRRRS